MVVFYLSGIIHKIQRSWFIFTALFTTDSGRFLYTWHGLQDTTVVFYLHGILYKIHLHGIMYKIHVTEVFIHLHGIIYKIQVTARGLHSSTRHYLQDTQVVFMYGARRITGLVIGGVTIPELPIGKKKLNLISIILRKTHIIIYVIY